MKHKTNSRLPRPEPNAQNNPESGGFNTSPDEVVRLFLQAEQLREQNHDDQDDYQARIGHAFHFGIADEPIKKASAGIGGTLSQMVAQARAYHPTARHTAVLILAMIALWMPLLVPVLVLALLFIIVVTYLTLGHDRSAEFSTAAIAVLARRNPEAAEKWRSRAEHLSARLTVLIASLPERWTQGLYLPDFSAPDRMSDELSRDPFDRLNVRHQDG